MSVNRDLGADAGDSAIQDQQEKPGEPSIDERADRFLLFEVYMIQRDEKMGRLLIPKELALDHFPPLANRRNSYTARIKITTPQDFSSIVTVSFNVTENAFAIDSKWWREYVNRRFTSVRPLHSRHFLVEFVKGGGEMLELSQVLGTAGNDGNGNRGTDGGRNRKDKGEVTSGSDNRQGDEDAMIHSVASPRRRKLAR
ncbi:hypothetical protein C3L33_07268, partial [Rhododendron williamsianum]